MTTVIMMLMFPIGLYMYFVIEKKTRKEYQKVFDDFQVKISDKQDLSLSEKEEMFSQMLLQNGYELKEISPHTVIGEKKILSMGMIMIGIGVYFIGLLFYLLYYFYLQKPHTVIFKVEKNVGKEKSED